MNNANNYSCRSLLVCRNKDAKVGHLKSRPRCNRPLRKTNKYKISLFVKYLHLSRIHELMFSLSFIGGPMQPTQACTYHTIYRTQLDVGRLPFKVVRTVGGGRIAFAIEM